MLRNDYLVFGTTNTKEYSVGIYGNKLADPPEREYEYVSVPGKNGDLIIDKGRYKNKTIPYKAYIIDKYAANVMGLRNALLTQKGYQRLEDTINPDEFRMAQVIPFEVDEVGVLRAGEFTIEFNCKPQRFLKSGELPITYSAAGNIFNITNESAKPLIRVYGSGSGTVGIGSETITISSISSYVDIDCEIMNAFKGATNCNGNVSFTDNIVLKPGLNGISFTGNITSVVITPRWFRI